MQRVNRLLKLVYAACAMLLSAACSKAAPKRVIKSHCVAVQPEYATGAAYTPLQAFAAFHAEAAPAVALWRQPSCKQEECPVHT